MLVAGDLVTTLIPSGSYPLDWIGALERPEAIEAQVIIPGHGPVLHDMSYVRQVRGLVESVVAQVRRSVEEGHTLEQTRQAVDLSEWKPRFVGDDARLGAAFDAFFSSLVVERAYLAVSPPAPD